MAVSYKMATEVAEFYKSNNQNKQATQEHFRISATTLERYLRKARQVDNTYHYSEKDDMANVSGQARTLQELLDKAEVDLDVWEVDYWEIKDNSWDVTMKMTEYEAEARQGDEDRPGFYKASSENWPEKHTNKQFYIKVRLKRRKEYMNFDMLKENLLHDIKTFAPKAELIKYPDNSGGKHALEISLFDVHFGKFGWKEETGSMNYDGKVAAKRFLQVLSAHIEHAKKITGNIDLIVFPIGNDFFNSDSAYPFPATTRGTPQQEDMRWQKMFRKGWQLIVSGIEMCKKIAPVQVPVIPGNHDLERSFYMGEVIDAWYSHDPNVWVDNSAKPYKYVEFGNCLIGFAHGNSKDISLARLKMLMQEDVPGLWGKTKFREWHLGDIHHEKKIELKTEDHQALVLRYLRSISGEDGWHSSKGYKSIKGGESFLWHEKYGMVDHKYYNLLLT